MKRLRGTRTWTAREGSGSLVSTGGRSQGRGSKPPERKMLPHSTTSLYKWLYLCIHSTGFRPAQGGKIKIEISMGTFNFSVLEGCDGRRVTRAIDRNFPTRGTESMDPLLPAADSPGPFLPMFLLYNLQPSLPHFNSPSPTRSSPRLVSR